MMDGSTVNQKLTCEEVCREATALGFDEVKTLAGWIRLADWTPYGERAHKYVRFRLETDEAGNAFIKENAPAAPADLLAGFAFGSWPIRRRPWNPERESWKPAQQGTVWDFEEGREV